MYSFVYASDPTERVPGQSAVFDVIPGDDGYNDFWQMTRVLVPDDYEPDSVRSLANIEAAGYELKPTGLIINCTIVPYGSSVELASRESVGWYKDKHVAYFSFEATQTGIVNQTSSMFHMRWCGRVRYAPGVLIGSRLGRDPRCSGCPWLADLKRVFDVRT